MIHKAMHYAQGRN